MAQGPGRNGGSRKTVRKRAQKKRKLERERGQMPVRKPTEEATTTSRPVLNADEKDAEKRIESLAYEALMVATQLKKSFNNYGKSFNFDSPIIQDASRAYKILNGLIKDNKAKQNFERGDK